MTIDRWDLAEAWFHRLVRLDAGGRDAALAELAREDAALATEIRALLDAHDREGVVDRVASALVGSASQVLRQDELTGSRIGPYELATLVGRGGMGDVYRGRDTRLGREVAVKVLPDWSVRDPAAEERFLAEARAIATLDHPNVCLLLEADRSDDGRLFMVTPYYEGETLQERLGRGPLQPMEAAEIAIQVAQGLAAAHDRGVIHRDIKPSNLLITSDGRVKILDFGVAKLSDAALTRPGETLGTLAYMSPEQLAGGDVDTRTDLWSLGVVLHEMLTGRRPLAGQPSDSTPLADVVHQLLRPSPDDRYQDAREVARELSRCQMGADLAAAPGSYRRWGLRLATALSLAAIGVASLTAIRGLVPHPGAPEPLHRVAVLPLEVFSDDPGQVHVAEGLHDVLIAELSRFQPIQVISRQSVRRFSATDRSLRSIAEELEVDAVGGGSLFASGDRIRLSLWLSGTRPEQLIWSESYEMPTVDVLRVQREAARDLAQAMGHPPSVRTPGATYDPRDPAALEAFLRGIFELGKFEDAIGPGPDQGEVRIRAAVAAFEEAVRIDPAWARAHGHLALAYHWLATGFRSAYPDQFFALSKAAAEKALELDPDEPQALASLGFVLFEHEQRWDDAERAIQRSLEIGGQSHWIHALLLQATGRLEEAIEAFHRAVDIDRTSEILRGQLGNAYRCAGRPEEAFALWEALLRQATPGREDRFYAQVYVGLAKSLSELSRHEEAVTLQERAVIVSDSFPPWVADLAWIRARAGQREEARRLVEWWDLRRPDGGYAPAAAMVMLGDTLRAVEIIEDQLRRHDRYATTFLCEPEYHLLREHPRVQQVVRQVGYPGA
jgi:serine/threonine protein kinase/tetratricopeptide (TPR) repeat protein